MSINTRLYLRAIFNLISKNIMFFKSAKNIANLFGKTYIKRKKLKQIITIGKSKLEKKYNIINETISSKKANAINYVR